MHAWSDNSVLLFNHFVWLFVRIFFAMKQNNFLSSLTKEELIKLIEAYSKNWLDMDGVWFQSIERKFGMDEAMHHDREAWKSFTITEARRIKQFLGLPEHAGL